MATPRSRLTHVARIRPPRSAATGLALNAPLPNATKQLTFDRLDAVVGSPTTAIRARDLNSGGRLDLVVSGGQSVLVLAEQGDGRFELTWSGAAGENPVDLAIADLDGDGLADLAVANHETDHVTLLFGIAGGAFEHRDHSRLRVNVSSHPPAVRLHDIDSDGHADLLVDDRSPGSIRLFRGRGDGTFSGAASIDVGGDPYRGMSLADVTGDGLADLITPNSRPRGRPCRRGGRRLSTAGNPAGALRSVLGGGGRPEW